MFLKKRNKTKQNDEEKWQSILRRLSLRPLACKGNAIPIQYDTYRYTLALNLSHLTLFAHEILPVDAVWS